MRNFAVVLCIIGFCLHCCGVSSDAHDCEVAVSVAPAEFSKVPLIIGLLDPQTADTQMLAQYLEHDFKTTGQFDVAIRSCDVVPSRQKLQAIADEGTQLMLFIERHADGKSFNWRLYDTSTTSMIKGRRLVKSGPDVRVWAHELADSLWPILTGQDGFFSTKIAYCKEVLRGKKKPLKHLVVADFDGSNDRVVVPTIVVAPRWGKNGFLFYSECTNANVRLMYLDDRQGKHVAANFDGLNMQVSFSDSGTSVFCASRGRGSCQIYYCACGIFKQLTHNEGTNVSPTISADGSRVYFCSDYKNGNPAIYCCDVATGNLTELISHGLCPSYSSKINKLTYIKNVRGTMQVFVMDMSTKSHEQMTFDAGNKDECSFSPCGNFLIYSVANKEKNRIQVLNLISKEKRWITSVNSNCTYPAWSDRCKGLDSISGVSSSMLNLLS